MIYSGDCDNTNKFFSNDWKWRANPERRNYIDPRGSVGLDALPVRGELQRMKSRLKRRPPFDYPIDNLSVAQQTAVMAMAERHETLVSRLRAMSVHDPEWDACLDAVISLGADRDFARSLYYPNVSIYYVNALPFPIKDEMWTSIGEEYAIYGMAANNVDVCHPEPSALVRSAPAKVAVMVRDRLCTNNGVVEDGMAVRSPPAKTQVCSKASGAVTLSKVVTTPICKYCGGNTVGEAWVTTNCDCSFHKDCFNYLCATSGHHCSNYDSKGCYSRSRKTKPRHYDLVKIHAMCKDGQHCCYDSSLVATRTLDPTRWRANASTASLPQRARRFGRNAKSKNEEEVVATIGELNAPQVAKIESETKYFREGRLPISSLKGFGQGKSSQFATDLDRQAAVDGGKEITYKVYTAGKKGGDVRNEPVVSLDDFRKLQSELKDLRRSAAHMASRVRAQAADDSFAFTGKSKYLRSVLLPDEGAVGIPDDVIRLHHLKTETVTYNVTVPDSGSGIFFLYPNHPTNLIGYHYILGPTGYILDTPIYTAQDLRDSYDFGKKCSQILAAKSSSLPSGVFALNGTFNAIRSDGFISEIPGLNLPDLYNTILTNTVEPLDKIGNVLVGDGIGIISLLDSFGQPYTRLGDLSPNTISVGSYNNLPPYIIDRSSDLQYFAAAIYNPVQPAGSTFQFLDTTINVDSNTGVEFTLSIAGNLEDTTLVTELTLTFLDPFGNMLTTDQQVFSADAEAGVLTQTFSTFYALGYGPSGITMGPLAAVRIQLSANTTGALIAPASLISKIQMQVPTGARSGVNGPINVVTYCGVASGSKITLSGWTNYMLVPNPALRQNLPVAYNKVDVGDATWCKTVLGDRQKFGLRSVWNLKDYNAARPMLAELADTGIHQRAQALSGSDIIAALKRIFAPALRTALQQGAKVIPDLIGMAASGDPIRAISASGMAVRARACDVDVNPLPLPPSVTDYVRASAADWRAASAEGYAMRRGWKNRAVVQKDVRTVAFPVVLTHPELADAAPVRYQLYAASSIDHSHFHPEHRALNGSHYVQGYDEVQLFPINRNVYLFPIDPVAFSRGKIVPVDGPVVNGHSVDAAIWLVCNGKFQGILPYAITGSVAGSLLNANDYFVRKQAYLRANMVALAGNDENADVVVEDLSNIDYTARPRHEMRGV